MVRPFLPKQEVTYSMPRHFGAMFITLKDDAYELTRRIQMKTLLKMEKQIKIDVPLFVM